MANKKKTSSAWQWVGIVLVVILLLGAFSSLMLATDFFKDWNPENWGDNIQNNVKPNDNPDNPDNPDKPGDGGATDEDGNPMKPGQVYDMSNMLFRAPTADKGNATAETGITIKATVKPDDAPDRSVDWSVAFKNAQSSWANGKNINDFVTVTPTSDGAATATVNCLAAFGEQIVITVTSRDNPNASATATVDYAQRVTGATVKFGNISVVLNGDTNVKYEVNSSGAAVGGSVTLEYTTSDVYTVEDTFTKSVTLAAPTNPLELNGYAVSGVFTAENVLGKSVTFNRADINKMTFTKADSTLNGADLSNADVIELFSNVTKSELFRANILVKGKYSEYNATSLFKCTGFVNSSTVTDVIIDNGTIIF